MFNENQIKAILILLDDKGHPCWELAKYINVSDSYLNPMLKKLIEFNVVFKDKARRSTRKAVEPGDYNPKKERTVCDASTKTRKGYIGRIKRRNGDYNEIPYYLVSNLDTLKIIIKEIKNYRSSRRPELISGFIINAILESEYVKKLSNIFGKKEIDQSVRETLGRHHDYFTDSYLGEEYEPTCEMKLERDLILTDLELWYSLYLRTKKENETVLRITHEGDES